MLDHLPLRSRRGALVFAALAAAHLLVVATVGSRAGTHVEELAGLMQWVPERLGPGAAAPVPEAEIPALRRSLYLPVWSVQWSGGRMTPLMIDGHQGAVSYLAHRPLANRVDLMAARALSWLFGLVLIAGLQVLGSATGGHRAGWFAAALAATSPQLVFMQHWARPDEQLALGMPLLAVLGLIAHRGRGGGRYLVLAGLAFGLALAAKNTALWTLTATALACWIFDLWPRASLRTWALALWVGALPLLPQLAFVSGGQGAEAEAFWVRVATLPNPLHALAPERLRFFAEHFATSFGGAGSYVGAMVQGIPSEISWPSLAAGGALLLLFFAAVGRSLARTAAPVERALGLGLGALLLQYVGIYYVGMSLFGLLAVWVPLAGGLGLARWWPRAGDGVGARGGVAVVALVGVLGVQLWQDAVLVQAYGRPGHAMHNLRVQQQLAADLQREGVDRVWTTTYADAGVLEQLSDGRVRGVNLFAAFWHVTSSGPETRDLYTRAWQVALADMPAGEHRAVLVPRPAEVEVSPCQEGAWIAEQLEPAVRAMGGQVKPWRSWQDARGLEVFRGVKVTLPHRQPVARDR